MTSPPTVGDAIGFIISEPEPVESITGRSAIIVVMVVIIAGLTLKSPPSVTVLRISSTDLGAFVLNKSSRHERRTTALSVATPNSAINPTHTAVENLKPIKNRSIIPPIRDTGRPLARMKSVPNDLNAIYSKSIIIARHIIGSSDFSMGE